MGICTIFVPPDVVLNKRANTAINSDGYNNIVSVLDVFFIHIYGFSLAIVARNDHLFSIKIFIKQIIHITQRSA